MALFHGQLFDVGLNLLEPIQRLLQSERCNLPDHGRAMQRRGLALLLMILSAAQGPVTAQTQIANADWEGEWLAEGTLFRIGVTSDNGLLKITQIESMGQIWSSGDGKVDGNIARVEVEYATPPASSGLNYWTPRRPYCPPPAVSPNSW